MTGEQALRLAAAAYLSRFKALSRTHAQSDLRAFLTWCAERQLDPLAASRPQLELYVRWMQEIRRLKPSTTSRRMSIVAGFYRTAEIDGLIDHSPAEHVRRPHVPPESPTLGLTHLQLEALLTAARLSPNRYDFALVCLLGLLGLRIAFGHGADQDGQASVEVTLVRVLPEMAHWATGLPDGPLQVIPVLSPAAR